MCLVPFHPLDPAAHLLGTHFKPITVVLKSWERMLSLAVCDGLSPKELHDVLVLGGEWGMGDGRAGVCA